MLATLADNAKHNQHGRIDEFGVIRHREVELCGYGALALLFFAYFHILGKSPPSFVPDFSDPGYGEFGRREWYSWHVFFTKDPTNGMSYESWFFSFCSHASD